MKEHKKRYYQNRKLVNLQALINAKLVLPERQTCDYCAIHPDMVKESEKNNKTTFPATVVNRIERTDEGGYKKYSFIQRLGFSYSMAEFNRRLDKAEWVCNKCRRELNREARSNAEPVLRGDKHFIEEPL